MQGLPRDVVFTLLLHVSPRSLKSISVTNRLCHRITTSDYFLSQYFSLRVGKEIALNHKQLIRPETLALETPDNAHVILLFSTADVNADTFVKKSLTLIVNVVRVDPGVFVIGEGPANGCEQPWLFWRNGKEWLQGPILRYPWLEAEYILRQRLSFLYYMYADGSLNVTTFLGKWRYYNIDGCSVLLPGQWLFNFYFSIVRITLSHDKAPFSSWEDRRRDTTSLVSHGEARRYTSSSCTAQSRRIQEQATLFRRWSWHAYGDRHQCSSDEAVVWHPWLYLCLWVARCLNIGSCRCSYLYCLT